jgi:hypothetical protein
VPVVNLASRLQGAARPGEVLVTESVYERVATQFPHATTSVRQLKGHLVEHVNDVGLSSASDDLLAGHAVAVGAVLVSRRLSTARARTSTFEALTEAVKYNSLGPVCWTSAIDRASRPIHAVLPTLQPARVGSATRA